MSFFNRYLIPCGAAVALVGYSPPWVNHPAAGLAILGLDLAEYVKFLEPVRSGAVWMWREGFYLPLLTVSLTLSLFAFRREFGWALWLRILALGAAIVAALNMLPPAWTPPLLRAAEFRMQSAWMIVCLAAVVTAPLLALLPRYVGQAVAVGGAAASVLLCVWMFLGVLPAIAELYGHALAPAWGLYVMIAGFVMLAAGAMFASRSVSQDEVANLTEINPSTPIP